MAKKSILWSASQTAAASCNFTLQISLSYHYFSSADALAKPAWAKASICLLNRVYLHKDMKPSELFPAKILFASGTGIAFTTDVIRTENHG